MSEIRGENEKMENHIFQLVSIVNFFSNFYHMFTIMRQIHAEKMNEVFLAKLGILEFFLFD